MPDSPSAASTAAAAAMESGKHCPPPNHARFGGFFGFSRKVWGSKQRRRQRSVPASNFARPQTRPQLSLFLNSTVSRQMGATDQHREQFVSCCWSFLLQGKACCHKKSTPADARVDKFDNLWIILLPAGRHRHHRRGLLPAGQGRPRPHPEARRDLLRAQSALQAYPQKFPDE